MNTISCTQRFINDRKVDQHPGRERITEILDALETVKLGPVSDVSVTDSDIVFVFYLPENDEVSIRLEAGNLKCGKNTYTLERLEPLAIALEKMKE